RCAPASSPRGRTDAGVCQGGRQRGFIPPFGGSNPSTPATFMRPAAGACGLGARAVEVTHGGQTMGSSGSLAVVAGNANPVLAQDIARSLQTPLGRASVGRFSDGEVNVELMEN